MKILWITAHYFLDTDRQLVPYLRQAGGMDIKWVVMRGLNSPAIAEHSDYELLQLHYRGKDPRVYFQISHYLKRIGTRQYDLIYSDSLDILYYTALFRRAGKVPIVHAAHNVIPYSSVWGLYLRTEVKYIFARCRHFQLFSQHTARWFASHYPTKSFFYCPMPLKDFGAVRTDNYAVDPLKINLLFFGNIVANKRLDLLIDAVKHLPEEVRERIHLNICGRCRMDQEAFIRQIDGCPAISYYFRRIPDEEIPELFAKHQFLVLPYEDVAQSGPHMIAYNYGLPVIASDIDGFAERVDNGVNGFLFRRNDESSLVQVLVRAASLSKEEYETIRTALKQHVAQTYSLPVVAKRYVDYFLSISHPSRK